MKKINKNWSRHGRQAEEGPKKRRKEEEEEEESDIKSSRMESTELNKQTEESKQKNKYKETLLQQPAGIIMNNRGA